MRFLNSSVAAPCAFTGWPSSLTVGLFTGGSAATGWALSAFPHAMVRTVASAIDAGNNFVMARPITAIAVPPPRSNFTPLARPHGPIDAQFDPPATQGVGANRASEGFRHASLRHSAADQPPRRLRQQ